jgi:hypothetical protein
VAVFTFKTVSPLFALADKVDEKEQEDTVALIVWADVPVDTEFAPTTTRAVPEFTLNAAEIERALAAALTETRVVGAKMIAPTTEKTTMLLMAPVSQLSFIDSSLSD